MSVHVQLHQVCQIQHSVHAREMCQVNISTCITIYMSIGVFNILVAMYSLELEIVSPTCGLRLLLQGHQMAMCYDKMHTNFLCEVNCLYTVFRISCLFFV